MRIRCFFVHTLFLGFQWPLNAKMLWHRWYRIRPPVRQLPQLPRQRAQYLVCTSAHLHSKPCSSLHDWMIGWLDVSNCNTILTHIPLYSTWYCSDTWLDPNIWYDICSLSMELIRWMACEGGHQAYQDGMASWFGGSGRSRTMSNLSSSWESSLTLESAGGASEKRPSGIIIYFDSIIIIIPFIDIRWRFFLIFWLCHMGNCR